jgi:hypothetical protein
MEIRSEHRVAAEDRAIDRGVYPEHDRQGGAEADSKGKGLPAMGIDPECRFAEAWRRKPLAATGSPPERLGGELLSSALSGYGIEFP